MSKQTAVRFIGAHVSFPVEKQQRKVSILKRFLSLEGMSVFKKIKSGSVLGKRTTVRFNQQALEDVIQLLEIGAKEYLSLLPYWNDKEWIEAYADSPLIMWDSSFMEPVYKEISPAMRRFGSAGHLTVEYPLSRFETDSQSSFQKELVELIRELCLDERVYYSFIHQGYKPVEPSIIGRDYVFSRTRDRFPLSMFDDLIKPVGLFKEYLKGAFWANFLSPLHVEKLGGVSRVREAKPCSVIEDLGEGWLLLQVGSSPLTSNESRAAEEYQRLRRFLKPILMETEDDMMRITREVNGSWRPPESADRYWNDFVAHRKKMDS